MNSKVALAGLFLALTASEISVPPQAGAFSPFGSALDRKTEVFDAQRQRLIFALARQPELMNVDYLRWLIGSPANQAQQGTFGDQHYIWYDRDLKPIYELRQAQSYGGDSVQRTMVVHLQGSGLTFDKLGDLINSQKPANQGPRSQEPGSQPPSRRFFDGQALPAEEFYLVPNCSLTFNSEPDTFRLSQACIAYAGPPLPPPDPAQMQMARAARLARAQNIGKGACDSESLALLEGQVYGEPLNPAAHLCLGNAYRQSGRLNDAISQYRAAYELSPADQDVYKQAQAALLALRVIQPDNAQVGSDPRLRDLELFNHGQRLRASGWQKQEQGDPRLAGSGSAPGPAQGYAAPATRAGGSFAPISQEADAMVRPPEPDPDADPF